MIRWCVLWAALSLGVSACGQSDVGEASEPLRARESLVRQSLDVSTVEGLVHSSVVRMGRSMAGRDPRVIVLIPGTLANGGAYYDVAPGTGFDAAEVLARAGYVVVIPDLPGSGASFRPADGRDAGMAMAARAVRSVAQAAMRTFHARDGVDLYGETGVGTNVALLLARESWVRSVSLSASFYLQFGPGAGVLFTPEYAGFLDSLPDGYLPQNPLQIEGFFGAADPSIRALAVTACMGPAPQTIGTGAFYDLIASTGPDSLATLRLATPIVAAEPARAPALVIQGSPDFIGSESGTAEMVAAYGLTGGGEAEMVVLPGASHLMRFDAAVSDGPESPFWSAILAFLARH